MKSNLIKSIVVLLLYSAAGYSAVINIPGDYPAIQLGINASSDGDTILVADGIYSGIDNRDITFGGRQITLKSVSGPAGAIIDCQGDQWNPRKGFLFIDEDRSTVLDGFTIKNGSTGPYCLEFSGGAIYCEGSPTIKNCRFVENTNRENSCLYSGGGGMFCFLGSPLLVNCEFDSNNSDDFGGAVNSINAAPVFNDCLFKGNSSVLGAAIHSDNSHIILNGCTFADNTGNDGILYSPGSSVIEMTNCTFAYNLSINPAAIELVSSDVLNVVNGILWNAYLTEIVSDSTSSVIVTYSDVMGGWTGNGNIDCDPVFCDPDNRDLSVSAISCCVGTGRYGNDIGSSGPGCGALGGVVTDQNGYPVEGVNVNIVSAGLQAQTAGDGSYHFDTVAPDVYDVIFSHSQYRDSLITGLSIPLGYVVQDMQLQTSGPCASYSVGDINNSGGYNGLDITYGVSFFKGGSVPALECQCGPGDAWFVAGDVNGSCSYNGLDITYGVGFFKGGDSPIPCPDCPPQ